MTASDDMPWKLRAFNISDVQRLARRRLPKPVFDFSDGGAEDERTLRRNEEVFGCWRFLPAPLNGSASRDLCVDLLGHRLSMPLIVGPTGLAGLFYPDGERATARAAAAAGTAYCLSHGSVCTLEDLAETGMHPRWMQVFIYRDRGFTRELTDRARAANYDALVLTIDNQILGQRERDLRNGFTIPPRFSLLSLATMSTKLPWLWAMRHDLRRMTFGNYVRAGLPSDLKTLAAQMPHLLDPAMSWADVEALRKSWDGPLILKGILHPQEAIRAINHGVDAIIVSNHGGRQLDRAVSSLEALPDIVAAVAGRMPVLLDGGIRRGADVVTALALGATACLIGRPHLWGLAIGGEAGVRHVLEIYRREINTVMGLCGLQRLGQIGPDLLVRLPESALKATRY